MIDRMADRFAHPADLTIPSFADRDDEHGAAAALDELNVGGPGPLAVNHDTASQPLHIVIVRNTGHSGFIDPGDPVARMREPRGKITVVRQNQQTF
jgi:hypothetical protein